MQKINQQEIGKVKEELVEKSSLADFYLKACNRYAAQMEVIRMIFGK